MATCIYCGSKDNLNTTLTIAVDDGKKAVVHVCDVHAEDATVKTARQKYLDRQSRIDELRAQAAELGLEISQPTQGGLILATVVDQQPKQASRAPQVPDPSINDPEMIDARIIDARDKGMTSVGRVASGGVGVESHTSIDLKETKEKLPENALVGRVKMEVVEGRSGVPLALPTKRVDSMGTTDIRLIKVEDVDLQRKFKQMANQSRSDQGWQNLKHYGKEGYDEQVNCTLCRGSGSIRNAGKNMPCPKCDGNGVLS